jgi:hypothetical protein
MRQINIVLPDTDVNTVLDIAKSSDLKAAHVKSIKSAPFLFSLFMLLFLRKKRI